MSGALKKIADMVTATRVIAGGAVVLGVGVWMLIGVGLDLAELIRAKPGIVQAVLAVNGTDDEPGLTDRVASIESRMESLLTSKLTQVNSSIESVHRDVKENKQTLAENKQAIAAQAGRYKRVNDNQKDLLLWRCDRDPDYRLCRRL